eukprot:TRINITY_DN5047_c0_g1_i1.p1 TRINITY_DN5047_c0_g1~~TRINITY_DN5047_c0_g1_i1.p1  ORF type:complete len:218 (+),score=38.09 TRINITY_DN5047_c0_g1_i1:44-655(+)
MSLAKPDVPVLVCDSPTPSIKVNGQRFSRLCCGLIVSAAFNVVAVLFAVIVAFNVFNVSCKVDDVVHMKICAEPQPGTLLSIEVKDSVMVTTTSANATVTVVKEDFGTGRSEVFVNGALQNSSLVSGRPLTRQDFLAARANPATLQVQLETVGACPELPTAPIHSKMSPQGFPSRYCPRWCRSCSYYCYYWRGRYQCKFNCGF